MFKKIPLDSNDQNFQKQTRMETVLGLITTRLGHHLAQGLLAVMLVRVFAIYANQNRKVSMAQLATKTAQIRINKTHFLIQRVLVSHLKIHKGH